MSCPKPHFSRVGLILVAAGAVAVAVAVVVIAGLTSWWVLALLPVALAVVMMIGCIVMMTAMVRSKSGESGHGHKGCSPWSAGPTSTDPQSASGRCAGHWRQEVAEK